MIVYENVMLQTGFVLIFCLCFVCYNADKSVNSNVELFYTRVKSGGKVDVIKGSVSDDKWVSRGYFDDKVNRTGFGYLELETNLKSDSLLQAYHVGFLEGYLTSDLIYSRWFNTVNAFCRSKTTDCDLAYSFVKRNSRWVSKQLKKYDSDPFWFQVKLFYLQLNGVLNGYNAKTKFEKLDWDDIFALNILQELGDVLKIAGYRPTGSQKIDNDHCSALVKILPSNSDIYFGHNTWTDYADMLRILKKYSLHYPKSQNDSTVIPGYEFSESSYPGAILSMDDYCLIGSSGLAVMETTNEVFNNSLFNGIKPQGIVFEAVRTVVANRLAVNGESWHEIFKKYNSGTYNNQFMVLDYNRFKPGQKLGAGVLWVGEQLPQYYISQDVTDILVTRGYWSSYNVPYFKSVYKMSGYEEELHTNGSWFSYTDTPRAKIFARDEGNVRDMDSFMRLMRSNNFNTDPYAFCNCTPPYSAAGAIAARRDLNPAEGKGTQVCKPYGATDAKITNYTMFKQLRFDAVAGPTRGTDAVLPVFQWSGSPFATTAHMLQPDVFNFEPVSTVWILVKENGIPQVLNESDKNDIVFNPNNYNWYVVNEDDNKIPID